MKKSIAIVLVAGLFAAMSLYSCARPGPSKKEQIKKEVAAYRAEKNVEVTVLQPQMVSVYSVAIANAPVLNAVSFVKPPGTVSPVLLSVTPDHAYKGGLSLTRQYSYLDNHNRCRNIRPPLSRLNT